MTGAIVSFSDSLARRHGPVPRTVHGQRAGFERPRRLGSGDSAARRDAPPSWPTTLVARSRVVRYRSTHGSHRLIKAFEAEVVSLWFRIAHPLAAWDDGEEPSTHEEGTIMATLGTIQTALQANQPLYVRERRGNDTRFERIDPDGDVRFFLCDRRAVRFTTDDTRHEVRCSDVVLDPPDDRRAGVYGR